jgi:hypothetical protein
LTDTVLSLTDFILDRRCGGKIAWLAAFSLRFYVESGACGGARNAAPGVD